MTKSSILAVLSCPALACVAVGIAGAEATQLTTHPAEDRSPSWSPDSRHLLFASERDGNSEIYLIDRDGNGLRRLTDDPASDRSPAWSPDGERFVFESDRGGDNGLWIQELSSGMATSLLPDPSPELIPDWSPDGEWIAFTSMRAGNADLYRVSIADGTVERLTTDAHRDVWPRYSTSGDRLVFFSRRATEGRMDDLWLLDLEDGSQSPMTAHTTHHDFVPDFSPDGLRVVAGMSDREAGKRELVIHHVRDGVVRRFAGSYHRVFHPTWSPDGRWIAYAARVAEGEAADIYLEPAVGVAPTP